MTWLENLYRSDRGWNHLETLVDIGGRLPGTDAERRAAEVTRDVLEETGARDARLESYEIQGWERGTSTIRCLTTKDQYRCLALPRSPAETARGELIDLRYGLPSDFEETDVKGAVVMVASGIPDAQDRYIHRNEKFYYAVKHGANGFVFRSTLDGNLPMTGSVGIKDDPIGAIPALGVSKEEGLRMIRQASGEEIEVSVEADIGPTTSQNIHAKIGPDTDKQILLTSHVDAHDLGEGAVDNGTGTAGLLETVNALSKREDELETCVHAIAFGSEEIHLVGSEYQSEQIDLDSVKAIINLDGIAQSRTMTAFPHGHETITDAVETVGERFDHPITVQQKITPYGDHWPFMQWGIPGCFLSSKTTKALRGWGHTHGDTLDKVDIRDLREHSIIVTELTVQITKKNCVLDQIAPEQMQARIEQEGYDEGMKIMGTWPYEDTER